MEFTGERLVPGNTPDLDLVREHVSRYAFAAPLAKGRRVLDLGCGTGYGSRIIADAGAKTVLGIDISEEAVRYSREHYETRNVSFQTGNATSLKVVEDAFDVVVCFEVIEHLEEQEKLLRSVSQALGTGGLFIVSTPNIDAPTYSEKDNPFHVKELDRLQFEQLLGRHFNHVATFSQFRMTGLGFMPLNGDVPTVGISEIDIGPQDSEPLYFVAVCSDSELPQIEPVIARVPYFGNLDELLGHLYERDRDIEDKDLRIVDLQKEVDEKTDWAQTTDRDLKRAERELSRAKLRIVHQANELERIESTFGYRAHVKLAPLAKRLWAWIRGLLVFLWFLLRIAIMAPVGAVWLLLWIPKLLAMLAIVPRVIVLYIRLRSAGVVEPVPKDPVTPVRRIPANRDGISVIVPSWNALDLVQSYLPSVAQDVPDYSFPVEVILVDNGSTDGTAEWVEANLPQVRVLRLDENMGFGGGCNEGAKAAKYGILYMLNNDMRVEPGFLRPIWDAFSDPDVFSATSRILFEQRGPAARRREESGLTTASWHRGLLRIRHHFDNDTDPASTLYAGGGSSAFCRAKFEMLEGFSEIYQPFYVEDLDLSYRAWKRGFKVVYMPDSTVVHRHRGTIGRLYSRSRLYDVFAANFLRFTWRNCTGAAELRNHCLHLPIELARTMYRRGDPGDGVSFRAMRHAWRDLGIIAHDRRIECKETVVPDRLILDVTSSATSFRSSYGRLTEPRRGSQKPGVPILFISPYCPYPPTHGGAVRMYNIMKQAARNHPIGLVSMIEHEQERESKNELLKICDEVHFMLRGNPDRIGFWDPTSVQEFYSEEFHRLIDRVLANGEYRIVQMEYTILAHFKPDDPAVKTVLTEIDLYFVSYRRAAGSRRGLARRMLAYYEWLRMFRYELRWARRYDMLFTMSEHDRDILRRYVKESPIAVVHNGVDIDSYPLLPRQTEGRELLFVGNFRHDPNLDAALWMAREIFPLIKQEIPDARLAICGPNPPAEVSAFSAYDGIEVAGFVPDLAPRYQRASCFVAPITRGSGTRLKILEAMSSGLPVVSTTLGAEGISCSNERNILLADTTRAFAEACIMVLKSPDLAGSLSANGRKLVEQIYDWDRIGERLEQAYDELLGGVSAG